LVIVDTELTGFALSRTSEILCSAEPLAKVAKSIKTGTLFYTSEKARISFDSKGFETTLKPLYANYPDTDKLLQIIEDKKRYTVSASQALGDLDEVFKAPYYWELKPYPNEPVYFNKDFQPVAVPHPDAGDRRSAIEKIKNSGGFALASIYLQRAAKLFDAFGISPNGVDCTIDEENPRGSAVVLKTEGIKVLIMPMKM
jgi:hypothetical protein